jgi:hypothetical protein
MEQRQSLQSNVGGARNRDVHWVSIRSYPPRLFTQPLRASLAPSRFASIAPLMRLRVDRTTHRESNLMIAVVVTHPRGM